MIRVFIVAFVIVTSIVMVTSMLQLPESISYAFASGDNNLDNLYQNATDFYLKGQYNKSIGYLDTILVKNPEHVRALVSKGALLGTLGNSSEAIKYYDMALEIDPNDVDALYNKGYELYSLEKYKKATDYFDKTLNVSANHTNALYYKGLSFEKMEKPESALDAYNELLEINPNHSGALYNKANLLEQKDMYKQAVQLYDRILNTNNKDVKTLSAKASALKKMQRYGKAISVYDKILEMPEKLDAEQSIPPPVSQRYSSQIQSAKKDALEGQIDIIRTLVQNSIDYSKQGKRHEAILNLELAISQFENNVSDKIAKESLKKDIKDSIENAKKVVGKPVGTERSATLQEGNDQINQTQGSTDNISQEKSKGGGCLIATAAFGSDMAPEVQKLREVRDNVLLETKTGKEFMNSFNAFYYGFSPTVAQWEKDNAVFKEAVRISITPMIHSMSVLNIVDIDSETDMILHGSLVIVFNVIMYVGIPAVGITMVKRHYKLKQSCRVQNS